MRDKINEIYSKKDLSELSRVTLVIPTYNRNFYLSRCLWYHAHFPFAEIIVADSSSEEKRIVNRATVKTLRDKYSANITYLEYDFPAEEYGGEIYRKWGDAVQHVKTEYSLSCTDKEFLIPTTITSSVQFLDLHPDYSIADGLYYRIKSLEDIECWQENISIDAETPMARIQFLLSETKQLGTQFTLHRTKNYKRIFDLLQKYNLFDVRFGETAIELIPIIIGKLHRDSSLIQSIRDFCEFTKINDMSKKAIESSYFRYPRLSDYPKERYYNEFNHLIHCINEMNILPAVLHPKDIKQLLDQRYNLPNKQLPPDNLLLRKFSILYTIWEKYTPYIIKYHLSKKFGAGLVQKRDKTLYNKQKFPEVNLILWTITKTMKYHDADEVIPFDLR